MKLIYTPLHTQHHIHARGYVERPSRINRILKSVQKLSWLETVPPRRYPEDLLASVHDWDYVSYLKAASARIPEGKNIYPYVFPVRRPERKPKDRAIRAGYYCIDTFTPINRLVFSTAKAAWECALTGAELLLAGDPLAYALCRPPGHHAGRRSYGGFCYFNNAAAAAQLLRPEGRVAVLDIDFHHGNGTQEIFYETDAVYTVSIHGNPDKEYPYFAGFEDERGAGAGEGYNLNIIIKEGSDERRYLRSLRKALDVIRRYRARFLIVSVGYDIVSDDPTGSLSLPAQSFTSLGEELAGLGLPTLLVQEGGYHLDRVGACAVNLLKGLESLRKVQGD